MIANLSISILWLPLIFLISACGGFFFRSAQIKKAKKRVLNLESEMLNNHAEILKLQHEIARMEKTSDLTYKSRVVPMKDSQSDDSSEAIIKKKLNK